MARVIMMARMYQKRPSEILGIKDEYLAYCFDEVAYFLMCEALEKDGSLNWDKFKWKEEKVLSSNKTFVEFIKKHHKL